MYFYLSEKNVNQNDTFQPLVMGSFEAYNALEIAISNNKNNNEHEYDMMMVIIE